LAVERRPGSSSKWMYVSCCPLWSRTARGCSSTDQGSGKRRAVNSHRLVAARKASVFAGSRQNLGCGNSNGSPKLENGVSFAARIAGRRAWIFGEAGGGRAGSADRGSRRGDPVDNSYERLPGLSMPITGIALLRVWDMACSFVFGAPCQIRHWRGRSTADHPINGHEKPAPRS
jgi:hypothetical protein